MSDLANKSEGTYAAGQKSQQAGRGQQTRQTEIRQKVGLLRQMARQTVGLFEMSLPRKYTRVANCSSGRHEKGMPEARPGLDSTCDDSSSISVADDVDAIEITGGGQDEHHPSASV